MSIPAGWGYRYDTRHVMSSVMEVMCAKMEWLRKTRRVLGCTGASLFPSRQSRANAALTKQASYTIISHHHHHQYYCANTHPAAAPGDSNYQPFLLSFTHSVQLHFSPTRTPTTLLE